MAEGARGGEVTYRGMKYQQRGHKVSTVVKVQTADGGWLTKRVAAETPAVLKRAVDQLRAQSGKVARGSGTMAELMARYISSGRSRTGEPIAPTTARKYQDLARHIQGIGGIKVRDLKPKHVRQLRDDLLGLKRQVKDRDTEELRAVAALAPQTISDVLRLLSQACLRAVADGDMTTNPAASAMVPRPGGDVRPFVVIDAELAEAILAAVRGTDPWDPAAHLALGSTLRREEVLGLTWDRVDLDAGTVTVDRTVTFADGQLHHGGPKSKAGRRTLPLSPAVLGSLKRHKAAQAERRLKLGEAWSDLGVVVDNGTGGYWSPPSFSKGWERFAKRHGFEGITYHTLRHGWATTYTAAGVPDAVIAAMMGHADTNVLKRYRDVLASSMRDAVAKAGAYVGAET
jgi:integrase